MIGYCDNCKHRHTLIVSGWAKCGYWSCGCNWRVSVPPPEWVNRIEDRSFKRARYDDRSLRAVILHTARDAYKFPNCTSFYDDVELGKREMRADADAAFAEGLRRGFPADLEALAKIQNDETLQLHRENKEGNRGWCNAQKLCGTCKRILAGGNIWWPPT